MATVRVLALTPLSGKSPVVKPLHSSSSSAGTASVAASSPSNWPSNDALDKRILTLALPAILNFAVMPLVGIADTFFVGRMGDPLALAGQGAANQIFSSASWIFSFFPSVVTPLVAKAHSSGDGAALRARVGEALLLGTLMGLLGTALLVFLPHYALSAVLPTGAKALDYAAPYLSTRAITFLPAILSTICFATYRGTMDVMTPLRISVYANLINVLLDPYFIFNLKQGVVGAAVATCIAEVVSVALYLRGMARRRLVGLKDIFAVPKWSSVKPLVLGGLAVQLRAVGLNIAFLAVTRTTQALDTTGIAAAAHAITIQLWQLGGIFLLAMGTVGAVLVPSELAKAGVDKVTATRNAKRVADRMLSWGVVLGVALSLVQLLALPLLKLFSPLPNVQEAARLPSVIGAGLQLINGVVFIGEGIQQGNGAFGPLAAVTVLASIGMVTSLRLFGSSLVGVWASFATFNLIRLAGVLHHHFIAGPLTQAKIDKMQVQ